MKASGAAVRQIHSALAGTTRVSGPLDEIDVARAQEYSLLALLLARAPDASSLKSISTISGDASRLGIAHANLAAAAADASPARIDREYFDLFVGLGRGELLPYGSFYLTGFLNERPLARLRADLRGLGIIRTENQVEPEDHAATLCEVMAGLAAGHFPSKAGDQEVLFEKHLAPWIGRFFVDLERNEKASFYRHVGTVGRVFIEIETDAFALPA